MKSLAKKRAHPEDDLAMAVADYLERFAPPYTWWHVPNGGQLARGAFQGERLRKMGMRAGVFDLHFILPGGRLGVIELKIKPNKPTPEQLDFQRTVLDNHGEANVCYSFDEVMLALKTWGYPMQYPRTIA